MSLVPQDERVALTRQRMNGCRVAPTLPALVGFLASHPASSSRWGYRLRRRLAAKQTTVPNRKAEGSGTAETTNVIEPNTPESPMVDE